MNDATSSEGVAGPLPAEVVLGYSSPLVGHPGSRVDVRVASTADRYSASVVRLVSAGPGTRTQYELVRDLGEKRVTPRDRMIRTAGSSVVVGPSDAFVRLASFTVSTWIFPTLLTLEPQTLLATLTADDSAGWAVLLDRQRGIGLRLASSPRAIDIWSDLRAAVSAWTHVAVSVDTASGRLCIAAAEPSGRPHTFETELSRGQHAGGDVLSVGAPHRRDRPVTRAGNGCFNGKLSAPTIYAAALGPERIGRELRGEALDDRDAPVVCRLDLADALDGYRFRDHSSYRHEAVLVNQPVTGVTGPSWHGGTVSYLLARDEYSAIHFHDDDLEDADWELGFNVALPAEIPSGVYATRLATSDCEDLVPFFVTSPGESTADVVLMLPTLTYLAYANEHEILSNPPSYTAFTGREPAHAPLGWRDRLAVDEGLLSLYDVHRDGSSVCFASTKRPLLNLRPDYAWPLLEAPHGLAMDLRLIAWLEREGFEYDLLTDHDLHSVGAQALEPYRVAITGAHPEYWTGCMLDALETYLDQGGRLMYLGGNGLHGVTGIDPDRPHIAEVRRPQVGSRPSSAGPGELWLTTTGEEGGTWRSRGRPSHALVGVGTTSMGAGPGRPYRRCAVSYEPAYAWVFEGVDGEQIGATGGILGGAAAYEFDRADGDLGTPGYADVLATASDFRELYYPLLEDFVGSCPEVADPGSPLVRADMVMMIRGNGGGAFSVGSAAWCGSLGEGGDSNDVGIVTANVLRRFTDTPRGEDPLLEVVGG